MPWVETQLSTWAHKCHSCYILNIFRLSENWKKNECRCKKIRMRLQKRFHPIILQLNIDSILVLFSRFHIGEYVCPLFTVNCRVFKFPSKMQAETGQIGNRLKLTKKSQKRLWKFHVARARENHEKTTWKYIQVILSAIQKKLYEFFRLLMVGAFNNYVVQMLPNFDPLTLLSWQNGHFT